MNTLLVNLDRSPERLDRMTATFAALKIGFRRFPAFDCAQHDVDLPYFRHEHRRMIAGEYGTMRSHLDIYKELAESDAAYYVIFEDDIVVSPFLAEFLRMLASHERIFESFDLLRLETYVKEVVVDARRRYAIGPITFMRLLSTNFGTAGYVVPRTTARRLIDIYTRAPMLIDHMFGKYNMERFGLRVGQAVPALVVQDDRAEDFGVPSSGIAKTFRRPPLATASREVTATRFGKNISNEAYKIFRLVRKACRPVSLVQELASRRRVSVEFHTAPDAVGQPGRETVSGGLRDGLAGPSWHP